MPNDPVFSEASIAGWPRWARTLRRILGVLRHPGPTFIAIAAEPDWFTPLLVLLGALVLSGHPIGISLGLTLPVAAVILLIAFRLAGGRGSFAQAFAATVYSAYPRLIKAFIVSVVAYSHLGPLSVFDLRNPLRSNLGVFVDPNLHPRLFTLAASVDPFMLWSLALASIGFTALSGLRRPVSAVIVFGLWAAFVLVAVLGTGTPPPP